MAYFTSNTCQMKREILSFSNKISKHEPSHKINTVDRSTYSDKDLTWIEFIKRLKATGMPIKEIRHYAELRAEGDPTLSERMEMLVQHRQALNEQITRLQEHKITLDEKIEFYNNEIERVQRCCSLTPATGVYLLTEKSEANTPDFVYSLTHYVCNV